MKTIALIGNPNVGKSVLFYRLTGSYATVSNYPGTTVEISRGRANILGKLYTVYDTPGMYSFSPLTEEEKVTRRLLMEQSPDLVIHVADAKNLPRMLPLTIELINAGFAVILVLNMIDEAEKAGVYIRKNELARRLKIPVLEAAFLRGRGILQLKKAIAKLSSGLIMQKAQPAKEHYLVSRAARCLQGSYPFSKEMMARLCLEEDPEAVKLAKQQETREALDCLAAYVRAAGELPDWEMPLMRYRQAESILAGLYLVREKKKKDGLLEKATLDPLGGLLITALVIYFGLYLFVGRFGAGVLVALLEEKILGGIVIPVVTGWLEKVLPAGALLDILIGEFGIVTMALRYILGIILPVTGTFFLVFALLEDSGYLPRLAFFADSLMRRIGLNGRAVIPLALGFGCGTMGVLVTRTLESRRERLLASFLLAAAIPCSAQLGLIIALLAGEPIYLLFWALVVAVVFFLAGMLLDCLLPGSRTPYFMELPPLRLPGLYALLKKTFARMYWYLKEVMPVFTLIAVLLWLLQQAKLLQVLIFFLQKAAASLGLPPETAGVFLYGFFRRDYGAAGLWELHRAGAISGSRLLVASVVLTLFLPCSAQLAVMVRERGIIAALAIAACTALIAYTAGFLLNLLLRLPVF